MNKKIRHLLTQYSIDAQCLLNDYGKATIDRGIAYFEASNVLTMTETDALQDNQADFLVAGTVSGSYRESYSTTLRIEGLFPGDAIVSNQCSCPVGYQCKHGIALLFNLLDTLQQEGGAQLDLYSEDAISDEENIDNWIHFLRQTEDSPGRQSGLYLSPPSDEPYHAIYTLDYSHPRHHGDKAGLNVRLLKARALKKGGYGQIYPLDTYELSDDFRYHLTNCYRNELDREIAPVLSALPEAGYGTSKRYFMHGETGQLVFTKILQTGRSFWKNHKSPPLIPGDTRSLELKWLEEGNAYRSKIECTPQVDMLFALNDLYYFDEMRNQCGLATHESLTSEQLLLFANAPPIPRKIAKEVSQKMAQSLHEIDCPFPVKLNYREQEIKETPPVFCLRLHGIRRPISQDGQSLSQIHLASLHFEYNDMKVEPRSMADLARPVTTCLNENTRYRIHRDNDLEQQAISRLKSYGFVTADLDSHYPLDLTLPAAKLEESVLAWDDFRTRYVPGLEADGWVIEIDDSFSLVIEKVDDWYAELEEAEGGDWFEMNLGFELNGEPVNFLPLLVDLLAANPDKAALHDSLARKEHQLLQLSDTQWVKVPAARISQILDTIIELYDTNALTAGGGLVFSKLAGLNFNELLNDPHLRWKGADELRALNQKLRDFAGIEAVSQPDGLQLELRDYQKHGLDWLQFLRAYGFNGILADDMGLGKTAQTLANLLVEKAEGRADLPSLVIAPTSLMSNWKNEAEKFTPDLRVLMLQGSGRKDMFDKIDTHDLILTTYPLMLRDKAVYGKQDFHYLILDEAQAIKNAKTKTTQIIYQLNARHRLCVTGTPMENHLGEIWSIYHFLMPGYLGTHERFNRLFRTPIEKHADESRGRQLRQRIDPFLLRRTKDVVAKELPKKTEIIRSVPLRGKQRDLYETVRVAMDKKVRDEISKKGLARSQIMILDALLKLRQVCCDPQLVKLEKARKVKDSAKLELLMDLVPEMVEEGRKILLFSQFTSMLSIIETQLKKQKITYSKLTGQTRKRAEAIAAFQEGDASIFLISLKAGGTGLNLTAADTVIHYDPWWNPAVEKQATDRAYRIGQDKPVFVYKLLTEETVEEKILKMQEKKQALADALYSNKAKGQAAFNQEDLLDLLKPEDVH